MKINVMSTKDVGEKRVMHSESSNKETIVGNETGETFEELFQSLFESYQTSLKESMRCRNFVFDYIDRVFYKCHKMSLNRG